MLIRDAVPADIARIMEIWNPFILNGLATFNSVEHTAETLAHMLRDKHVQGLGFLVAEQDGQDGQVGGFASYGQFRGSVGYRHTYEHTVYVAPGRGGCDIGRQLLAATEDHARARGGHSMFAGVSAGNQAAIAFHRRLGYTEVARLPEVGRKFDRWHDLVLMQKFL